jgi:hypothetical protein
MRRGIVLGPFIVCDVRQGTVKPQRAGVKRILRGDSGMRISRSGYDRQADSRRRHIWPDKLLAEPNWWMKRPASPSFLWFSWPGFRRFRAY